MHQETVLHMSIAVLQVGGCGLETVCRRFKNCKQMCRNADYVSVGLWLMHKINEV